MNILAIDPGPVESGFYFDAQRHGVVRNEHMLHILERNDFGADEVAIEMIESLGMPVGAEVFETCVWIGRFVQAWNARHRLIYRSTVKLELCGSRRAKDANIRQALIDIYGPPGTKKAPGGTYGVKSHVWPAMAVWHVATTPERKPFILPEHMILRECARVLSSQVTKIKLVGQEFVVWADGYELRIPADAESRSVHLDLYSKHISDAERTMADEPMDGVSSYVAMEVEK